MSEQEKVNSEIMDMVLSNCLKDDSYLLDIPEDERARILTEASDFSQNLCRLVLSQMQPHFLFNVLNIIYYMCGKDPETAKNMVNDFSTYLRTNMNALVNLAPITLEQEIAHVHLYLRFEQMRFSDRFHMEYDLKCLNFKLPALTLQPLVENALRHGICPMSTPGVIRVESGETSEDYFVAVIDNGVGFDISNMENGGKNNLSLGVIRTRVEQISGGELIVHSVPGRGTRVEVRIPKEKTV